MIRIDYLAAFVRAIELTSTSQKLQLISAFANRDEASSEISARGPEPPVLPDIYMPEPRYFGEYYNCDWTEEVPGAATYLRNWILDNDPVIGISPGYYIGGNNWIINRPPGQPEAIDLDGTILSKYMTDLMLQDNPSDFIQDGHLDRKTFYYYRDTEEPFSNFLAATCVSPSELKYYSVNAYNFLFQTIDHYNYDVLVLLAVTDAYYEDENTRYDHFHWKFYANVSKIIATPGFPPKEPL